jgi:hypothetical protein
MQWGRSLRVAVLIALAGSACGGDEGVRVDNQITSLTSERVCLRFRFPDGARTCYRITPESTIDPAVNGRSDLVSIKLDGGDVESIELIGRGSFKRAPRAK